MFIYNMIKTRKQWSVFSLEIFYFETLLNIGEIMSKDSFNFMYKIISMM